MSPGESRQRHQLAGVDRFRRYRRKRSAILGQHGWETSVSSGQHPCEMYLSKTAPGQRHWKRPVAKAFSADSPAAIPLCPADRPAINHDSTGLLGLPGGGTRASREVLTIFS